MILIKFFKKNLIFHYGIFSKPLSLEESKGI